MPSGVMALADGMGGAGIGDMASDIAVSTVTAITSDRLRAGFSHENALIDAGLLAHARILEAARARSDCLGVGSTLVAAILQMGRLTVAHVGDSRAYLMRGRQLRRLTVDHSVGQQLCDAGQMTEPRARRLMARGPLTRALGHGLTPPQMALGSWHWCQGDLLLLCSDGLTDALDDGAVEAALNRLLRAEKATLQPVAQGLLTAALAAGCRDDITVLLATDSLPVHTAH